MLEGLSETNSAMNDGRAKASRQGSKQHTTGITYEINGSCTNNKLSQFAKIGNVLRQTGGSLQTTSNRNLILENKLFQKLIWQLKLAEEHTQMEMG